MMTGIASGSWSLVNFVLLQFLGPLFERMNDQRWEEIVVADRAVSLRSALPSGCS